MTVRVSAVCHARGNEPAYVFGEGAPHAQSTPQMPSLKTKNDVSAEPGQRQFNRAPAASGRRVPGVLRGAGPVRAAG